MFFLFYTLRSSQCIHQNFNPLTPCFVRKTCSLLHHVVNSPTTPISVLQNHHIAVPKPPNVAPTGPTGAFMVELLVFNGFPFKDHWAYWIRSHADPDIGVEIHATGDVRSGLVFEVKRSHNLREAEDVPTKRIALQWVDRKFFDEKAMLNNGKAVLDSSPVFDFEASAHRVKAPGKSLNAVDDNDKAASVGKKVAHLKDCQTWIVESADQLVADGIFDKGVAAYLKAVKQ